VTERASMGRHDDSHFVIRFHLLIDLIKLRLASPELAQVDNAACPTCLEEASSFLAFRLGDENVLHQAAEGVIDYLSYEGEVRPAVSAATWRGWIGQNDN